MLQVVVGSSRGEYAGDHIQFQICFWFDGFDLIGLVSPLHWVKISHV